MISQMRKTLRPPTDLICMGIHLRYSFDGKQNKYFCEENGSFNWCDLLALQVCMKVLREDMNKDDHVRTWLGFIRMSWRLRACLHILSQSLIHDRQIPVNLCGPHCPTDLCYPVHPALHTRVCTHAHIQHPQGHHISQTTIQESSQEWKKSLPWLYIFLVLGDPRCNNYNADF